MSSNAFSCAFSRITLSLLASGMSLLVGSLSTSNASKNRSSLSGLLSLSVVCSRDSASVARCFTPEW